MGSCKGKKYHVVNFFGIGVKPVFAETFGRGSLQIFTLRQPCPPKSMNVFFFSLIIFFTEKITFSRLWESSYHAKLFFRKLDFVLFFRPSSSFPVRSNLMEERKNASIFGFFLFPAYLEKRKRKSRWEAWTQVSSEAEKMDSLGKKRVGFPISHVFPVINSNIFPFSFPLTVEAITIRIFHRQNICDSSLSLLSRAVSSFLREKCGKASISRRHYLGKVRKTF